MTSEDKQEPEEEGAPNRRQFFEKIKKDAATARALANVDIPGALNAEISAAPPHGKPKRVYTGETVEWKGIPAAMIVNFFSGTGRKYAAQLKTLQQAAANAEGCTDAQRKEWAAAALREYEEKREWFDGLSAEDREIVSSAFKENGMAEGFHTPQTFTALLLKGVMDSPLIAANVKPALETGLKSALEWCLEHAPKPKCDVRQMKNPRFGLCPDSL